LRRLRVSIVENSERAMGLSTSVRRGLVAARFSAAVLLLPVDLARLKRGDIARMTARWSGARRRVVARRLGYGGTAPRGTPRGGTPLIVPRWLYGRALRIAGDSGLKELIGHLPRSDVELLDLPSAAWDVDTPQDLARARRRIP
jgi:molybdenum cofactor cytidylyltransferase